jgi:hypothetical protein
MHAESPGPVKDDEVLHLLLTDPQAIVDGKISSVTFSHAFRNGLSAIRATAPVEEYKVVLEELIRRSAASNGERYFNGVLAFPASLVREKDGKRLLCVYDTSLPGQPNHVDLMAPDAKNLTGNKAQKFQKKLKELLEGYRLDGEALFEGALIPYMRGRD